MAAGHIAAVGGTRDHYGTKALAEALGLSCHHWQMNAPCSPNAAYYPVQNPYLQWVDNCSTDNCRFPAGNPDPIKVNVVGRGGPRQSVYKRHHDRFSRFCTVHTCRTHTHTDIRATSSRIYTVSQKIAVQPPTIILTVIVRFQYYWYKY